MGGRLRVQAVLQEADWSRPPGEIMPCRSDEVARASLVVLMPHFWPWRSLAAYCGVRGDMRSIAPIMLIMVGRSLATFGGVHGCARIGLAVSSGWGGWRERAARSAGRRSEGISAENRGDPNLASLPRARAEPCRHLARRERVRRMRLSPTKRKWRLGEAGCWPPDCRASGLGKTCPR